ncbi:MFS transporter [Rhodospirillaceae bacterium SYSU D60014]|uniref:MFS transporter n=1 Tax=Virgifigura deserti TaxID=2268457 RepID=UPI000E66F126
MRKSNWIDLLREGRAVYTVILVLGIGLHAIDVFIIATVMPAVVADIGGDAFYAWSTMLYMIASIIGAASGGPLKAALGARKGYSLAGLLFLAGTVGCAISPTMPILLIARVVQGFGGGLLIAQSMALVRELYPQELRTRVLALISGIWGVAALIGPLFGGGFAELGWWRGAFWAGAPIILMFVGLAWWSLPASAPAASIPRFPIRRLVLLGAGVLCVGVTSTIEQPALQIGLLIAAVAMVGKTFRLDAGSANPLFPSNPLSVRSPVGTGYWIFFLLSITHTAIGIFLPLVLQVLHGATPLVAGYFNGVLALSWTAAAFLTSGWRGRGEAAALVGGPCLAVCGLVGLAIGVTDASLTVIALLVAMLGLGIGMCNLHLTASTMALAAPGEESLTASSIPTMRALGIAFGSAIAGLVANSAGLARGISPETVASAITWVNATTALAPAAAVLLALRLVRLSRHRAAAPLPAVEPRPSGDGSSL